MTAKTTKSHIVFVQTIASHFKIIFLEDIYLYVIEFTIVVLFFIYSRLNFLQAFSRIIDYNFYTYLSKT